MWPTQQFELAALPEQLLQTPAELHAAPSTAGSVLVVDAAGDAPASRMNTTENTPALALPGSNISDDGAGALPQTLALPRTPVGGAVNIAGDRPASVMNTPDDSPTLALFDSNIGDDVAYALPQALGLPHMPTELHAARIAVDGVVSIVGDCPTSPMNTLLQTMHVACKTKHNCSPTANTRVHVC